MSKQKERISNLLQLVKDNPDLRIVPMVYKEIVAEDSFAYWCGSWGEAEVDEIYSSAERIYFRSRDEGELIDDYGDNIFDDMFPDVMPLSDEQAEMVDKKATEIVNNLDWEKVIVVRIEMP